MSVNDTISVLLPAHLVEALAKAVTAGEYASTDEAVTDALDAWARRHEDRAEDLAWVKARIQTSLADPDPDLSEEEVDERLRLMFENATRRADAAA